MTTLSEAGVLAFLLRVTTFLVFAGVFIVRRVGNALTAAERKLALQAWQFRQLVPERARPRVTVAQDLKPSSP